MKNMNINTFKKYTNFNYCVILFTGLLGLSLLNSCDVVDGNYERTTIIDTNQNVSVPQNILISEYTGHTCGFCPPAAEEAKRLQNLYPKGRVIFMSVHVGQFAVPTKDYPADFRIVEAVNLNNQFNITTYPIGEINRIVNQNGQRAVSFTEWSSIITPLFNKEAPLTIEFEKASVNLISNKITAKVNLSYFQNVNTNDFLSLYIVEDSIVSDQKDFRFAPNDHLKDYVHYGILRGVMNGTWGEIINDGVKPVRNDKFSYEFEYQIPNNKNWRANHLRLIAFVHDNNNSFVISQVKDKEVEIE